MSNLMDMLTGALGGGAVKQISQQLGADESTTQKAVSAALPTLLTAISRNAQKPGGAEALHKALDKDHDGSILDHVSGLINKPQAGPGDGILRHVLGSKRNTVEAGLSRTTGLDASSTGKLMTMLAPMVMGGLGKQQREQKLDTSALSGLLGRERESVEKAAPQSVGMLTKLLDADGDGEVELGDFVKRGGGLLGKMLGGR